MAVPPGLPLLAALHAGASVRVPAAAVLVFVPPATAAALLVLVVGFAVTPRPFVLLAALPRLAVAFPAGAPAFLAVPVVAAPVRLAGPVQVAHAPMMPMLLVLTGLLRKLLLLWFLACQPCGRPHRTRVVVISQAYFYCSTTTTNTTSTTTTSSSSSSFSCVSSARASSTFVEARLPAEDLLGPLSAEPGLLLGLQLAGPCLVGVVVSVLLRVHHQGPVRVRLHVRTNVT